MTTQIIRNQYNEIQVGNFCQFGVRKKTNTGGGNGGGGEIPPNEIHFITTTGIIDYYGVVGDRLVFSDGTAVTLNEEYLYDIAAPVGKHKVVLKEPREAGYVGIGGEALIELRNFPTLSSVDTFNFFPNNASTSLVKVPTVLPPNIVYTARMFSKASSFNQDISMWDTSNITHMYHMFSDATSFNQPLNSWDTSNVVDMSYMFRGATNFNQPIDNWNTSNVVYMQHMFRLTSSFTQDLSLWCVPSIASEPFNFDDSAPLFTVDKHPVWGTCPRGEDQVPIPSNEMHFTTLAGSVDYVGTQGDQILLSDGTIVDVTATNEQVIFDAPSGKHKVKLVDSVDRNNYVSVGGEALVELHNFPTLSTVTKFNFATDDYNNLVNLTTVPTVLPTNITDVSDMFAYADIFNQDISGWDVSNVTNMSGMFRIATVFNQDISGWDVSNVTDMSGMFNTAITFNQPLNTWNVSNVTNIAFMFIEAFSFNQPIGNWDVSKVTDMFQLFRNATVFNQPLDAWNVSNVTNMTYMFYDAIAFNQDLSQWCVPLVTSSPSDFAAGSALIEGNFPIWGTCPA